MELMSLSATSLFASFLGGKFRPPLPPTAQHAMAIASPTNTAIPLTENLDVRLEDMETGEVDGGGKGDTAGNGVDEKATDAQGYETTDLDIEDEQEPAAAKAPEPPDGGASWLVVAAAFTAMFFAVGMQYSQGSYIRAYYYTNHFGADSYFSISWVGAVNSVAFPMFAPFFGPLVGFLGPQIAAISGAAIQGLAFILASFAKTTWQMILSQGLIFGIGEVLIYMAGIAAIQQHFSKKRGLAVGLTMSGSGFGGLAVSIMCQSLIDAVGFAWSLRIVAFLLFGVGAVCGLLMRPLVPPGFRTRVKGKRGRILDFEVFKVKYFKLYYLSNGVAMFGYFVRG